MRYNDTRRQLSALGRKYGHVSRVPLSGPAVPVNRKGYCMAITSDHITGFALGLGSAAVLFYAYRKNQPQVDEWLRQQGIMLPVTGTEDPSTWTLEQLMREKERLEDLIAEREVAGEASVETSAS